MDWDPKDHEPNDASSKEFELLAYHGSLCELTKCIDHEECTNRDAVEWEKFKSSPAYELSYEDQKECLETAHDDGNGKDGLVGYEILSCGLGEDRYQVNRLKSDILYYLIQKTLTRGPACNQYLKE